MRTKVLDLELKLAMAQAMQQSDNENDDDIARGESETRQNSDSRFLLPPEETQEPSNAAQSPLLQNAASTNPLTIVTEEDHANPEGS